MGSDLVGAPEGAIDTPPRALRSHFARAHELMQEIRISIAERQIRVAPQTRNAFVGAPEGAICFSAVQLYFASV